MVTSKEPVGVMTSGSGEEPMARALRCDGPSGSRGADSSPQSQREALGISGDGVADTVRRKRQNFFMCANRVMDDDSLSAHARLCYWVLCRYANTESGECFPAQDTIATKAKISRSSVQRGLMELADAGYITIETREREDGSHKVSSNLYTMLDFDDSRASVRSTDSREPCVSVKQELNSSVTESMKETTALEAVAPLRSAYILSDKSRGVEKKKRAANVMLTDSEYSGLCTKYTKRIVDMAIEQLDAYKQAHGRRYKSDAGALRQWAIQAAYEREAKDRKNGAVQRLFGGRICPRCGARNTHSGGVCSSCHEDMVDLVTLGRCGHEGRNG